MSRESASGDIASMSLFIDFIMATTTQRVVRVADHRRGANNPATDFYRPLREAMVGAWKQRRGRRIDFGALIQQMGDARAQAIYPKVVTGYERFLAEHPKATYFEPAGGLLPIGAANPRLSIAINPEMGLVIDGVPHHLKLWFRSDTLTQKRVDITIALMIRLGVPDHHRLAMLDLREAAVYYLSKDGSSRTGWPKLDKLITGEAAAYGTLWGLV